MFKTLVILLVTLWVCLAVAICINMYHQFEVSKLQLRMLNDYKLQSAADNIFQSYRDSLEKDANLAQKRIDRISMPFPFKSVRANWLLLRLGVILLVLLTALVFWIYYKRPPVDKPEQSGQDVSST